MEKSTRRNFIKLGAVALALGTLKISGIKILSESAHARPPLAPIPQQFFYSACMNNCGSCCVLKCYTNADNEVIRIETESGIQDDWENGIFQVRACPRGRSYRRYMYTESRLKYPMKRVGNRGEGKFERITWEEALDTIATKLKYCIDTYGNESVYSTYASGVGLGTILRRESFYRLMNIMGGFVLGASDYSSAQNQAALRAMYGIAGYSGNAITDIAHTKLAVFFGVNITETRMSGGGLQYEILEAKAKNNTKIIVIDPRYSETCVTVADEWIPIRPGTDAALASALAYVMIQENMVDMDFVRNYVQGFDSSQMPLSASANTSYSDYILGTGYDMIPKTPEWASQITGIPAMRIVQLAREMGQAKPCYIAQGWGLQRQANGEMQTLAVAALATITGNVGLRGGNNGDLDAYFPITVPKLPTGENPVKISFPVYQWLNVVDNAKDMNAAKDGIIGADTFPTEIKFIWNYAGNGLINQHSEINNSRRVLGDESKCEMIVVMDSHNTSSAQWADILLPSCAYNESADIYGSSYGQDIEYYIFSGAAKPYYESKTVYEVCTELSKRLGVEQEFTEGRDHEAWLEYNYQNVCRVQMPSLPPTLAEAREQAIWHQAKSRDLPIKFEPFRNDPIANPLNTPSGKIELYSEFLQNLSETRGSGEYLGEEIYPVAQYIATWESYGDIETRRTFPLQMIGHHYKGRTHSMYGDCDWLKEVMPQRLWINPLDAKKRGIDHDDMVAVFNERGEVHVQVKVTPRIMPGVVSLPQGAWYTPDENGVDTGGCTNTLTAYRPTIISKANPQHTNLVEVRKI